MNERERAQEMRRELGRKLRELRTEAGLSQRQLASRTGYTRSAVSNSESGGYVARRFWGKCDELFGTGTALVGFYERIRALSESGRQEEGRADWLARPPRAGLPGRRATEDLSGPAEALAVYHELGWPAEQHRDRFALITGTVVEALEVPRPAGLLAARWWMYTGGAADEVRGLPALPRPEQALVLIVAGDSCFFLAAPGSFDWSEVGLPDDPPAADGMGTARTGEAAPGVRWHCLGSRIPAPPSVLADGQLATWAYLPARQIRLTPAIGLLDLLAKAIGMQAVDRLRLPGGVSAIPVTGRRRPPADDTADTV